MTTVTTSLPAVLALLEEAQARGFVGPGPVQTHIDLARSGVALLVPGRRALDLGSGGGALGLPLAAFEPAVTWALVEASETRADFLRRAVHRLGMDGTVTVVAEPAELAGRAESLRGSFDLVVARSFGPSGTTAECAAPFLRVGGVLAVTEPPEPDANRWPSAALSALGLELGPRVGAFQTLDQRSMCPDRFPRRIGVPRQRPLF